MIKNLYCAWKRDIYENIYLILSCNFSILYHHFISSSSISYGVPQGSVLGQLLSLIFINDLPNLSSLFKFILFADDSTLSTSFAEENAIEISLTLNHELNNVNNSLTSNRICINPDKTKYMISHRKR